MPSNSFQVASDTGSARFLSKNAMLSSDNKFMFQKIGGKTVLNQTLHSSRDYSGVVDWAVT